MEVPAWVDTSIGHQDIDKKDIANYRTGVSNGVLDRTQSTRRVWTEIWWLFLKIYLLSASKIDTVQISQIPGDRYCPKLVSRHWTSVSSYHCAVVGFFPFLNLLSQRCYCYPWWVQPWPVAGPSWSHLELAPLDTGEASSSLSSLPPKLCPANPVHPKIKITTVKWCIFSSNLLCVFCVFFRLKWSWF